MNLMDTHAKQPITTNQIHWLAGLLDGEGCFTSEKGGYPRVSLRMTKDQDTMQRAAAIMGTSVWESDDIYASVASGPRAVGVMLSLYPLMSARRQARIRDVIAAWRPVRKIGRPRGR